MTNSFPNQAEDLAKVREQLQAEISQARGILKDLRYEIKQLREGRADIKQEVEAARKAARRNFEAEVTRQVEALAKVTSKTMDSSVERIIAKFDELYAILTGQTKEAQKKGEVPLPDLIQQRVATHGPQKKRRRN